MTRDRRIHPTKRKRLAEHALIGVEVLEGRRMFAEFYAVTLPSAASDLSATVNEDTSASQFLPQEANAASFTRWEGEGYTPPGAYGGEWAARAGEPFSFFGSSASMSARIWANQFEVNARADANVGNGGATCAASASVRSGSLRIHILDGPGEPVGSPIVVTLHGHVSGVLAADELYGQHVVNAVGELRYRTLGGDWQTVVRDDVFPKNVGTSDTLDGTISFLAHVGDQFEIDLAAAASAAMSGAATTDYYASRAYADVRTSVEVSGVVDPVSTDVSGAFWNAPRRLVAGADFMVPVTVKNNGPGFVSGVLPIKFFLSEDAVLDSGDIEVPPSFDYDQSYHLAVGQTSEIRGYGLRAPVGLRLGKKMLLGRVDGNDKLNDTNPANNVFAQRVTLTSGPFVTSFVPPLAGAYTTGDVLTFTIRVSEAVAVKGKPRLQVRFGDKVVQATYSGGTQADSLAFRYVVRRSDIAEEVGLGWRFVLPRGSRIWASGQNINTELSSVVMGQIAEGVRVNVR